MDAAAQTTLSQATPAGATASGVVNIVDATDTGMFMGIESGFCGVTSGH